MLKPKLNASLSTPSKSPFLGNNKHIKVYPGKNRTKGNPSTIRSGESGAKAIARMRAAERVSTKYKSPLVGIFISI